MLPEGNALRSRGVASAGQYGTRVISAFLPLSLIVFAMVMGLQMTGHNRKGSCDGERVCGDGKQSLKVDKESVTVNLPRKYHVGLLIS